MTRLSQPIRILPLLVFLIPAVYQGAEPEAVSISPLGGRRGTHLEATVRGKSLQGAYAVWFDRKGITARIKRIEELQAGGEENQSEKSVKVQKLVLGLQIDAAAGLGRYTLRLVSPQGVRVLWFSWFMTFSPFPRDNWPPAEVPGPGRSTSPARSTASSAGPERGTPTPFGPSVTSISVSS